MEELQITFSEKVATLRAAKIKNVKIYDAVKSIYNATKMLKLDDLV